MPRASRPRPRRRRAPVILLLAVVGLALAILGSPGATADAEKAASGEARAAGDRMVVVNKVTGVERGEVLDVEWTGFEPNERVYLHQCEKDAPNWTDCAEVTRIEAVSDSDGAGTVEFPVWGGAIPRVSGAFGQGNNQIQCVGSQCDLVVSECPFSVFPDRTVRTNIGMVNTGTNPTTSTTSTSSTTTTTLGDIDPAERISLTASGSTELEEVVFDIQGTVLNAPLLIDLEYTLTNSPSGNNSFAAGFDDFAISGLPLNEAQLGQLEARGQGVAYVPLAVGNLALATWWELNGIPLRELNLSAATIARIYQGDLTLFFEDAITEDNGGCGFPVSGRGPRGGFRTDQSSSNYWFSRFLDEESEGEWLLGADPIIPIESSLVTGRTGAKNLALWIELGGTGNASEAPVAFFDHAWMKKYGHVPIHVRNGAGEWVIPTRAGAKASLEAASLAKEGYVELDPGSDETGVYPMTVVYYAIVPTELTTTFPEEEADALADMLRFLTSDEGQEIVAEHDFVPLSPELQELAAEAIEKLPGQAPTTTTTTTSTTTSSTSSTTTTPTTAPTTPPTTPATISPITEPPTAPLTPSFDVGPPVDSGGSSSFDSGGSSSFTDTGTGASDFDEGDSADEVAVDEEEPVEETAVVEEVVEEQTILTRTLGSASASPALPALLVVGLLALATGPVMRFFGQRSGL